MSRRKDSIAYIDYNADEQDPVFCEYCKKVGVKARLQDMVYDDYRDTPTDADNFLYCPSCKRQIPIYATKPDVEYGPVVDLVETPFDVGSRFASPKYKKRKKRRGANKVQEETDTDILGEKGNVNIIQ